ncbi:MAG: AgmX/PglI C-terminal domain-containing protein [Byssovorax sp.]
MSPPSQPPPSHQIPGVPSKSIGGAAYLVGVVVLLGLAVGLFVWKKNQPATTITAQSAAVTATAPSASAKPPALMYAPPPPPKIEEEPDAGAPQMKGTAPKGTGAPAGTGVPSGPCSSKCEGTASGALKAALLGKAQTAQGCYQRALRTSDVSGKMTVSVQVSSTGSVCSASIANDSLNSPEVASCVLGRFRGQSLPPPDGGCVTVNIPISFQSKQ